MQDWSQRKLSDLRSEENEVTEDNRAPIAHQREIQDSDAAVLKELIALETAALDPYFAESDPSRYVALFADEATYFDPNSAGRLHGGAYKQHFAAYAGQIPPFRYKILNPAVHLLGDTAVFTFNVEVVDPADDTVAALWNTTEVHYRTDDRSEIVHAHWSYTEPGS
jgi:ketosteroid isomerase-like protein